MADPALLSLALTIRARLEGECLLVHYVSKNPGAEPLYSYDGAPGAPDEEFPDLSSHLGLFVSYRQPAGPDDLPAVSVKRILGTPPPGRKVTDVFIPAVFRLMPGKSREVRFRIPVPLIEKSEFSPDFPDARYELRSAKVLQLVIGYMALPPETKLKPFADNPLTFKVVGAHGSQDFASAAVELAVPVKVRTDGLFYCP
jgi:hypothetical protein